MRQLGFRFRYLVVIFILIGCIGLASGCGPKRPIVDSDCIPQWYTKPPKDPDHIYAVSTSSSQELQMAVIKAEQDARVKIAQQIETQISALIKQFMEETGLRENSEILSQSLVVSKSVVDESLSGSKVVEQKPCREGVITRVYLLMEMPIGLANAALVDKIKQDRLLYEKFRASQAYQELEEEIKKKREFKKLQNE